MARSKKRGKPRPAMAPCRDARTVGIVTRRSGIRNADLGEAGRGRHARVFMLGRHFQTEGPQLWLVPRCLWRPADAAVEPTGRAHGGRRLRDLVGCTAMRTCHARYLHWIR